MNERFKVVPALFTVILRDGQVLLLRRQNTGWLDDYYDLPSGHLERNETLQQGATRELEEETGLIVSPEDLRLTHIYQNYHNLNRPYMGFIFKSDNWLGEPKIREPEKCDDMQFFSLDKLPKTVPYVEHALGQLASKEVTFSYWDEGSMDAKD